MGKWRIYVQISSVSEVEKTDDYINYIFPNVNIFSLFMLHIYIRNIVMYRTPKLYPISIAPHFCVFVFMSLVQFCIWDFTTVWTMKMVPEPYGRYAHRCQWNIWIIMTDRLKDTYHGICSTPTKQSSSLSKACIRCCKRKTLLKKIHLNYSSHVGNVHVHVTVRLEFVTKPNPIMSSHSQVD